MQNSKRRGSSKNQEFYQPSKIGPIGCRKIGLAVLALLTPLVVGLESKASSLSTLRVETVVPTRGYQRQVLVIRIDEPMDDRPIVRTSQHVMGVISANLKVWSNDNSRHLKSRYLSNKRLVLLNTNIQSNEWGNDGYRGRQSYRGRHSQRGDVVQEMKLALVRDRYRPASYRSKRGGNLGRGGRGGRHAGEMNVKPQCREFYNKPFRKVVQGVCQELELVVPRDAQYMVNRSRYSGYEVVVTLPAVRRNNDYGYGGGHHYPIDMSVAPYAIDRLVAAIHQEFSDFRKEDLVKDFAATVRARRSQLTDFQLEEIMVRTHREWSFSSYELDALEELVSVTGPISDQSAAVIVGLFHSSYHHGQAKLDQDRARRILGCDSPY